jgi:hypothetical protein
MSLSPYPIIPVEDVVKDYKSVKKIWLSIFLLGSWLTVSKLHKQDLENSTSKFYLPD